MILIARKDLPVDGLQQSIAYVKKNQATVHSGSAGIGSTGYVDCRCSTRRSASRSRTFPIAAAARRWSI